jgi:hypothetical protein
MCIKDSKLEAVCQARLRAAGIADEDLGALDPGSFSGHRNLTPRTMEGKIGIEKLTCKRHYFVSAFCRRSNIDA